MELTRREFLRVSSLAAAASVVAACAQPAEPTTEPAPPAEAPTTAPAAPSEPPAEGRYKEAPMLSDLVASGDLPPVDERLPENPCVLPVKESIGKYGGTWRRGFKGVSDATGPTYLTWNSLTRFNEDLTLNTMLAESWDINEDATVWTWHLRKGTRWSDGTPLTTEHTKWWWENHVWNEEISPSQDGTYKTGSGDDRQMCELEILDDYSFALTFAHPNPLFGFKVIWRSFPMLPGHYLEQFHADFADKAALDKLVEESGVETWMDVYNDKRREHLNPEVPRLDNWVPDNEISNELYILKRNPYCWCVDEEGQQLPYIDQVNHRLYETPDVFNMWVINGEIDLQGRHVDAANFTLFKENEQNGDYQVLMGITASHVAVQPNLTSKKPVLRRLYQNRDVRFALNYAVNREEMNELVYDGLLVPRQYSPLEGSGQFYAEQAFAHLEYDPDKANELLDTAGYAERDADGYRVDPETGETISFEVEGLANPGTPYEDAMLLVVKYWGDVGIKCQYKYSERSLYEEHQQANEMDCGCWAADRTIMPMIDPGIFLGTNTQRPWADAWGKWRNDPTDPNAEEPPEGHWIRTMWDIWDQVAVEPDYNKRNELFYKILDVWKEEIPMQGYLGEWPQPIIKKVGMRNYVGGLPYGWLTHGLSLLNCATFFWEEPEKHV